MKTKILLIITTLLFLTSCKDELDELTMFNITNNSSFNIPATAIINTPLAINTPDIETDSNSDFENNNSRKDLIESAKLKEIILTIESPETGSFDFLDEIELFINAEGLSETRLASKFDIEENGATTLDLNVEEETELSEYLKKDNYSIRVRAVTDKTINQEYTIKTSTTFFIDAEILGL